MTHAPDVTRVGKPRLEARLIMDAHGQIREANDAAHRLLQYRPATLVGLSLAWIMPPSRHTLLGELMKAFKEGARRSLAGVLMRDDGGLVPVVMTTAPCSGPRGQELALTVELDEQVTPQPSAPPSKPTRLSARPPAPRPKLEAVASRQARSAKKAAVEVTEQLAACMDLLRWLDTQLERPGTRESPRDRALARIVLQEASQLIALCQSALSPRND